MLQIDVKHVSDGVFFFLFENRPYMLLLYSTSQIYLPCRTAVVFAKQKDEEFMRAK